jgi:hypothetical protein
MVLVEGSHDRSHDSKMLTSEDHRDLAKRCLRLAKTCTKPGVAEQLMMLAANYLELAERTLIGLSEIQTRWGWDHQDSGAARATIARIEKNHPGTQ